MKLSLVIPVGPNPRFLRDAVLSALPMDGLEILVVEDAGDTAEHVGDLPVVRLPNRGRGMAAARNTGLAHCRTPFVSFLDSDDLLSVDSLAWRLAWVETSPVPWVAGTVEHYIDENSVAVAVPNQRPCPPLPTQLTRDFFATPNPGIPLACWSVLGRTAWLPRFDESLRWVPDTDFLLQLVKQQPLPLVNRPVIRYRLHQDNVSGAWHGANRKIRPAALAEAHLLSLSEGLV